MRTAFSIGKGALKVTRRSNPVELSSSLAVIKSILLTANRSNSILLGLITTAVWTCAGIYSIFFFFVWVRDRGEHGIYDCYIDCLHINSSHCTSSLNTNFRSSQCYIAGSFLTSLIFFSRFSATRISLISEGWRKNEAVPNYTLCLSE